MFDRLVEKRWLEESSRWLLNRLGRLFLFVRPLELGRDLFRAALPAWEGKTHAAEIIRVIEAIRTEEGLRGLQVLRDRYAHQTELSDTLFHALSRIDADDALAELARMHKDGQLTQLMGGSRDFYFERNLLPKLSNALRNDKELERSFRIAIAQSTDSAMERIASDYFGDRDDEEAIDLLLRYLDAEQYPEGGEFASKALAQKFSRSEEHEGGGWVEIYPHATNPLRMRLVGLALAKGASSARARELLMALELNRMFGERPIDEPRHPDVASGTLWPDSLYFDGGHGNSSENTVIASAPFAGR
jgi:hypothetical protein